MKTGIAVPLLGIVALTACAPRERTPDEMVLLDETVSLTRAAALDTATRRFTVDSDGLVVAIVDEQLTDVHVMLESQGRSAAAKPSVDVENHLSGAGIEIAALEVPDGSNVTLTVAGRPDATFPGKVHVRVLRLRADEHGNASYSMRLAGYRAWTSGTRSNPRVGTYATIVVPALDRAIASFDMPTGDPALGAQARLVKANGLRFFQVDFREARAVAQAARQKFESLPVPDALGAARAKFVEARALDALSRQRAAGSTSVEGAAGLAREILVSLSGPDSVLPPIERARALSALGELDVEASNIDDADRYYVAAQTIYKAEGYLAGDREIRGNQGLALLERGRFRDAAEAFEGVLPELDLITDPERRVRMYLGAARGQSFSGHTDRAVELQLKAIEQAREYKLRAREASALQGLGHAYQNRGDMLQARAFFAEALRIMRETNDAEQYVWALASAGVVAREDGDHAKAVELHEEAVARAMNPIAKVRTLRELGMDYYMAQDYPKAIAEFRRSLAVKLQDPKHHAYSDVKRNLAQSLVDQAAEAGGGSDAAYREATKMLDESLESSLKVGDKLGVLGAHRVRGELYAVEGRSRDALAEFENTFALAKEFRDSSSSTEAKGATLAHEQYALRGFLDVSLQDVTARGAAKPRPASPVATAALYTLENARDTYFGPARPGELDADSAARADSLLQQMADKSVRIATLLQGEDTPARATELATLQSNMSDLHAELDQLRTAAAAKRVASPGPAARLTMRDLPPGTVQVSYALGNRHAYAWARSDHGIVVTMLSKAPRELEQELIALAAVDRQADPIAVEKALAQMSADLLPRGLLPPDATAIEIVSEGRIAAVPFAGLIAQDASGERLVQRHALTMVTSMFSSEPAPRAKQPRPFRLVALASGTSGLRSVPVVNPVQKLRAASSEIRSVADLFTASDPRANVRLMVPPEGNAEELRRIWGSGADVVHFATHALADLRQPLASLLVMPATDARGAPTYLTAGQVEAWRGDAELVFLSACDSAIGPPRFAGGMPGLQRAFLRAGAHGVIATLWPIEDVMAQEFSEDFYRRYTKGESAAQALGETQRAWLEPAPGVDAAEQARRRITALAHGFYRQ